jgi:hypothetical protein
MDVSNSGLNSTIRLPIERQTAEVPDIKRHTRDSDIERREAEKSDEGRQERQRRDHRADRHSIDLLV